MTGDTHGKKRPPMTDREEHLEQIKMYREAGRHYFNTRSNLTYINILGCGAVAVLFAKNLLDAPNGCYGATIETYYWLYVAGLLIVIALAAWATAICNLLSNTFFSYVLMFQELEEALGIRYPKPKSWAVTFEFLGKEAQAETHGRALQGNVWNLANAFLAVCGVYVIVVISEIAHVGLLFYVGGAIYVILIALLMSYSVANKFWMVAVFIVVIGVSAVPLVAPPAQLKTLSHMSFTALSPSHDTQTCETEGTSSRYGIGPSGDS